MSERVEKLVWVKSLFSDAGDTIAMQDGICSASPPKVSVTVPFDRVTR